MITTHYYNGRTIVYLKIKSNCITCSDMTSYSEAASNFFDIDLILTSLSFDI